MPCHYRKKVPVAFTFQLTDFNFTNWEIKVWRVIWSSSKFYGKWLWADHIVRLWLRSTGNKLDCEELISIIWPIQIWTNSLMKVSISNGNKTGSLVKLKFEILVFCKPQTRKYHNGDVALITDRCKCIKPSPVVSKLHQLRADSHQLSLYTFKISHPLLKNENFIGK